MFLSNSHESETGKYDVLNTIIWLLNLCSDPRLMVTSWYSTLLNHHRHIIHIWWTTGVPVCLPWAVIMASLVAATHALRTLANYYETAVLSIIYVWRKQKWPVTGILINIHKKTMSFHSYNIINMTSPGPRPAFLYRSKFSRLATTDPNMWVSRTSAQHDAPLLLKGFLPR